MEASQKAIEALQANLKSTVEFSDQMLVEVKSRLSLLEEEEKNLEIIIQKLIDENAELQQRLIRTQEASRVHAELECELEFLVNSIEFATNFTEDELGSMVAEAESELERAENLTPILTAHCMPNSLADCKKILDLPSGSENISVVEHYLAKLGGSLSRDNNILVIRAMGIEITTECQ